MRKSILAAAAMSCAATMAGAQARTRTTSIDSVFSALTLDAAARVVIPYASGDGARSPGGWIVNLSPGIPNAEGSRIASQLYAGASLCGIRRRAIQRARS